MPAKKRRTPTDGAEPPRKTRPAKKARAPKAAAPSAPRAAPAKARPPATKRAAPPKRTAAPAPAAPKPAGPKYAGAHVRLLLPMDAYDAHKDDVKAPLKEHGLKWQFLGPGQGRYHSDDVSVFARFGDDGVDYTLRGDERVVEDIIRRWRALGATDVTEKAAAIEEAEEVRAWRLAKPVRRPGEPEGFWARRLAEWDAKDPRKGGAS